MYINGVQHKIIDFMMESLQDRVTKTHDPNAMDIVDMCKPTFIGEETDNLDILRCIFNILRLF